MGKQLLSLLCSLCAFFFFETCLAGTIPASAVLITFADRTPYSELHTNKIIEPRLLEELSSIPELALMEHFAIQEALTVEKKLNTSLDDVSTVVESTDFQKAFETVNSNVTNKSVGAGILPAKTRMIGNKYHADYLIHGTIDYLGKNSKQIMLPLKNSLFEMKNPYLEALVTVRIIKAETGKVIWKKQEKGVSKESLIQYKGVTLGTGEFNNTMFAEAMDKISVRIARDLQEDIALKKLVL